MTYDFSPEQRLLLLNQYRILQLLDDDSDYWGNLATAVEFGYEMDYDGTRSVPFAEETLPRKDCLEVRKIVDMFMLMQGFFDQLEEDEREGLSEEDLVFRGFSEHQETKRWAYARFLVEEVKGIFRDVGVGPMGYGSGPPMLDRYRSMLKVWEERRGGDVTGKDLRDVLEAGELAPE